MSPEMALLISVGVTLAMSLATISYLHKPLQKLLDSATATRDVTGFGLAISHIVIILMPLVCLMTGPMAIRSGSYPTFEIVALIQCSMVGLLVAVLLVLFIAMAAVGIQRSAWNSAPFTEEQVQEIHRLLLKMEEYRDREILKHPHAG
jgi:hypothetical protein